MAHPSLISDLLIRKACPKLTSDHIGTNPIITSKRPSTHIHSTNDRNGPALTLGHARNQSSMPKGSALTFDQPMIKERQLHLHLINQWLKKGMELISNQPMIEERLNTYIWSTNDQRNAQHLYLINHWLKKGSALTIDTYKEPIQHACSEGCALTSDQVGTNPTVISEWPPVPD